jgi:hypothetical protein
MLCWICCEIWLPAVMTEEIFQGLTPCRLVDKYWCLRKMFCLHPIESEGSWICCEIWLPAVMTKEIFQGLTPCRLVDKYWCLRKNVLPSSHRKWRQPSGVQSSLMEFDSLKLMEYKQNRVQSRPVKIGEPSASLNKSDRRTPLILSPSGAHVCRVQWAEASNFRPSRWKVTR